MQDKLDPTRLTLAALVKILNASGDFHVTQDTIRLDLSEGAPANDDGTINIIHYCAWLYKTIHGT